MTKPKSAQKTRQTAKPRVPVVQSENSIFSRPKPWTQQKQRVDKTTQSAT